MILKVTDYFCRNRAQFCAQCFVPVSEAGTIRRTVPYRGEGRPEYLRLNSRVIDMVHYFMDLKKTGGGHMPRSTDPDRGQSAEGKKR